MLYAQFYQANAMDRSKIVEACGDRSVIILDARCAPASNAAIATQECIRRGYGAWSIHKGESFTRSSRVSGPHWINAGKIDDSAASATFGA